ncbi:MAG: hypothetical protein KJ593_02635 [Candidatus Omnitrophica bacterium]|nr:hypothetical protein [Candidatus Omnitrophota bacterium]
MFKIRKRKIIFISLASLFFVSLFTLSALAADNSRQDDAICVAFLSGIGCSHCAKVDPVLFVEYTAKYPNLVVIEYEIYKLRASNREISDEYFKTYLPERRSGIPFLILNKEQTAVGSSNVFKLEELIKGSSSNKCPLADGSSVDLAHLDITNLPGEVKFWTKNRVLISGEGGQGRILRKILIEKDISSALRNVKFVKIDPVTVEISGGEIKFDNAIKIGNWILQWRGAPIKAGVSQFGFVSNPIFWMLITFLLLITPFSLSRIRKSKKDIHLSPEQARKRRDWIIVAVVLLSLFVFFISARDIQPDLLERTGYKMPLPIFTFIIALIDGFNPCNMFVLTFLLTLLISASDSKARIYSVGSCFVFVVFVFYFSFMALWLNIFKYIGFLTPLRITIAIIALVAGLINCKELLFFKKGISLTIGEQHKGPLLVRISRMKDIIQKGSLPLLIVSSITLAVFASLVELPCTAGFPIIYTAILSAKVLQTSLIYYAYLFLYNLIYVIPLVAIIAIFGHTLKAKHITQRQVQLIKFMGGIIMILLGIILLASPKLIGIGL